MPALCSPETFAHGREDPSYGFMESNTAKCALQLLGQKAFIPPSMVEQPSAIINSRSVFIRIHGSALLKLRRFDLDRSPLFIFPDRSFKRGYFQYTVQVSPQACSKHGRKYALQRRVFHSCRTSEEGLSLRTKEQGADVESPNHQTGTCGIFRARGVTRPDRSPGAATLPRISA